MMRKNEKNSGRHSAKKRDILCGTHISCVSFFSASKMLDKRENPCYTEIKPISDVRVPRSTARQRGSSVKIRRNRHYRTVGIPAGRHSVSISWASAAVFADGGKRCSRFRKPFSAGRDSAVFLPVHWCPRTGETVLCPETDCASLTDFRSETHFSISLML